MADERSHIQTALMATLTIFGGAVFLFGCPGELEHPERFLDGGIPQSCPDIPGELFVQRCAGTICHEGANAAGGLELIAPDVESRLVDIPGRDCAGLLVDTAKPDASLLYQKLLPLPACGSPMPIGKPALNGFELECVREWIATLMPTSP